MEINIWFWIAIIGWGIVLGKYLKRMGL